MVYVFVGTGHTFNDRMVYLSCYGGRKMFARCTVTRLGRLFGKDLDGY